MRRALILAILFAAFAVPVRAAEKPGDPGTNVEMPFLIAPLSVDGKLYGYAYISLKVVAASQSATLAVRDKVAFVQDAFVRDVNASSIGLAADPKNVDKPALIARLLADVRGIVGATKVVNILLIDLQVSPIRPGEAVASGPG